MEKTDSFIENRIKWSASKHNLPTNYSFLYETLNSELKKYYNTKLNGIEIGNIVLLFLDSSKNWTLVGTKMVASGNESELNAMDLSDIKKMQPKVLKDVQDKIKFVRDSVKKTEMKELSVIDKSENEIILTARKGSDFFALWNILLMLSRLKN